SGKTLMRNSGGQPVYKASSANCPGSSSGALGRGRNGQRPQVCPAVPVRKLAAASNRLAMEAETAQRIFKPSFKIRTKAQFGPLSLEETNENDNIQLSYGLGWGLLKSPFGFGAFKEGHGEGFQHYTIIFPEREIGIAIISNSDNAESIFKELLEITIGDVYTPWRWEYYIPYKMQDKELFTIG